jgi:hypothetical protein
MLDEKEDLIQERDAYKCKVHRLNHSMAALVSTLLNFFALPLTLRKNKRERLSLASFLKLFYPYWEPNT